MTRVLLRTRGIAERVVQIVRADEPDDTVCEPCTRFEEAIDLLHAEDGVAPDFGRMKESTERLMSVLRHMVNPFDPSWDFESLFSLLLSWTEFPEILPSIIDCLLMFADFPEFGEPLIQSGFHIFVFHSIATPYGVALVRSISGLVAGNRRIHEAVLAISVESDSSSILSSFLPLLSNSGDESLILAVCGLLKSLTAFPLMNSEVAELVLLFDSVLHREVAFALRDIADAVLSLLKRNSPLIPALGDIVRTLSQLLLAFEPSTSSIVCVIGYFIGKYGMIEIDWSLIASFLVSPNIQIVCSAAWCLATVACVFPLHGINLSECIWTLHVCFQGAPHEVKMSLDFPIVTLMHFVDPEAILNLCASGVMETLEAILSTKSVRVLESLLSLMVELSRSAYGDEFVELCLAAEVPDAIRRITCGDDYSELNCSRIPEIVDVLMPIMDSVDDKQSWGYCEV
jgi:hypothetical protein